MPKPLVGDVLDTSRTPGWVNHPENDLLQPVGASAIVGEEKLVSDDGPFKSALSTYPSNKKSYRYLYHDENDIPIGAMQIRTLGPRSKKAVIQNLHVSENNRRQKIATKLLYRARQDFDVKHSHDLTTMGKAFSKAVKSSGGSVQPSLEQMQQELDAYHGSPHRFPPTKKNPLGEFDPTKIGTGEGAQAYGHGHYLAQEKDVAKTYQPRSPRYEEKLIKEYNKAQSTSNYPKMEVLEDAMLHKSPDEILAKYSNIEDGYTPEHAKAASEHAKWFQKNKPEVGGLYHVRIPHEHIEKMLDWDKPLSEQHPHVQAAIKRELPDAPHDTLGQDLYNQYGMTAKAASDKLRRAGVAGIKYLDERSRDAGEETRNFVVFPGNEHIMKVVHREAKGGAIHEGNSVRVTTYKAKGGAIRMADGGQPFYSPVDQAISKLSQAKGTGDQYLSMIRNTHGVKPQEIEDRGLEQKMTGKMGLPDVQRIASENPMPKITESVAHKSDFFVTQKGDDDKHYVLNDTGKRIAGPFETQQNAEGAINRLKGNKTQYEKYQLKGGNNYREIKLKLPVQEKNRGAYGNGELSLGYGASNNFQSSHFKDEPNILAHARVSDRKGPNGEKILHVEEIQSDWHQQARDLRHEEIDRLVENGMPEEEAKKSVPTNWGYGTPEDRKHIVDKLARDEKLTPEEESRRRQLLSNRVVPDAPFKKDWHELALKHLLDHAVKNGYDKMIITPGAEQAKRYDLSKHIGEINYKHNPDKTVSLMATDKENGSTVLHEEDVPHHKIHRYVGKGIAKKIMAGEGTPYQVSIPYEGGSMPIPTPARHAGKMTLSNLDLKTGDEGMKGFYDKIVPDFLNKYGKKWGAKVGTYRMADPNKDYNWSDYVPNTDDMNRIGMERFGVNQRDMTSDQSAEAKEIHKKSIAEQRAMNLHSFDITPQMREDIMSKGQSRYNKGGDVKPLSLDAMRYALMGNGGGIKEPKSTVPAYKLFRVDKKQPGKLFPLFVDANTPVEKDKWVKAKAGEMAGEKVKSKIGPLAYRPGWHAGDLPIATHIGEKSDPKLNKPDRRPNNQVWAEIDMPNDVDWQKKANERGMNKKGKLIAKNAHITDQIPKGGHYRYKTNPNMSGSWLIGGEMKVKRVLPDEEVQKINKKAKVSDLPRSEPLNLKDWGFKHGGSTSLLQNFKD